MSFFAALFDTLVILEGACVVVGGVKSRVKRSFWAVGGGGAADDGTDLTGFEVVGGVNVSADRSVRCVRRAWAAVFVGGALTTGTTGVAGVGGCTAGGAGAAATGTSAASLSRTDGSAGGGPSIAHRRDSYFDRIKDSIL